MWGMYIPGRCSGKTAISKMLTKKGSITMKTIKRHMIGGYVQFTDGTYGKVVAMDRLVQLARDGLDVTLTVTDDDTMYIDVHEDEASAFEPSLYFDYDEDDECFSWTKERREAEALAEFYSMYSDAPLSPLMLTNKIVKSVDILELLWTLNPPLYEETLHALREDMTTDMKTILTTMDVVNDPNARKIFNTYMAVWQDLNFMEDE